MIRLILLAVGAFIVWVLFLSEFTKQQKITICIAALLICTAAMWFEQSSQTPKDGVMSVSELADCGVRSKHTYRTNFDIQFCLRNNSSGATAKRIAMSFVAMSCESGNCQEIQVINKDLGLSLEPQEQVTLTENLNFDKVEPALDSVVWIAKVVAVKALD